MGRSFLLALILLISLPLTGYAIGRNQVIADLATAINIVNEGRNIDLTGNVPLSYKGRTYVPLRVVAEALGFQVTWDGNTQTVEMKLPDEAYPLLKKNGVEILDISAKPELDQNDNCNRYVGHFNVGLVVLLKEDLSNNAAVTIEILDYRKKVVSYGLATLSAKQAGAYTYNIATKNFQLPLKVESPEEAVNKMLELYTYRVKIN